MSSQLPKKPSFLLKIIIGLISLFFLAHGQNASAYEYTLPTKKKIVATKKRNASPRPILLTTPPVYTASYNQNPIVPRVRETVEKEDLSPTNFMNVRIHPVNLLYMISQKNTLASLRGDIDFILSNRFTIGPSVIYHHTLSNDEMASNPATAPFLDESLLELGLLSNIYLTGTTSTGGFILRPHVYWMQSTGEKTDNAATPAVTAATDVNGGLRAGLEFIYQVILPVGLNFEIGGGLTYHAISHSIDYPSGDGTTRSEPSSRIAPTVSIGVGWAF